MHYYKRNIGDYAKKCGRLSMLEHGAYTLLLDACYDREQFPTREQAIEWSWARTKEEIDAVDFVLSRFFDLVDGVYVQKRIQEELETYQSNSETNRRIATEREQKRKERERSVNEHAEKQHEPPPNQEPRTINQEPRTINQEHTDSSTLVEQPAPTTAAAVCVFLKSEGIGLVNPQHPRLLELVKSGAKVPDFSWAAQKAVDGGKGFEYVLGIVRKQREDAAVMAQKARDSPRKCESFQERAAIAAAERMAEFAPGVARKIGRVEGKIIDVEVANVAAIESH